MILKRDLRYKENEKDLSNMAQFCLDFLTNKYSDLTFFSTYNVIICRYMKK